MPCSLAKAMISGALLDRAIVIDKFGNNTNWRQASQITQIDSRLGVARADQNAAFLGDQRENVTWTNKVASAGVAVGKAMHRHATLFGGNAGGGAMLEVDRNCEGR